MTDRDEAAGANRPKVELTKKDAKPGTPAKSAAAQPTAQASGAASDTPRSIILTVYAIYTQLVFSVIAAALSFPLTTQLRKAVIDSNNKATGSNHKQLCGLQHAKGCLDVNGTVHSLQIRTVVGTLVIGVAIVLALVRIRRGVRSGRTIYIVASILGTFIFFAGSPLAITAAITSGPVVPRVVQTIAGLASAVAIVVLLRPDSQRFFDVHSPKVAGRGGGFGTLFSPRPPAERKSKPAAGLRSNAQSRAQGRIAKAKSRNDVEAIARNDAAARTRARASKSRRTDI